MGKLPCGNGVCDEEENYCLCPQDCEPISCPPGEVISCVSGIPECRPSTFCGDYFCGDDEDCKSCPEDCGECCGNGICEPNYNESYENCPEDCCYPEGKEKPVLPGHYCCSGLQAKTIYDMDCVANQNGQCEGCEMIGAMVCVNCGNGVCENGENYCNCPEDCVQEIESCEQLPKLDANIYFFYSPIGSTTKLSWNAVLPFNADLLRTEIYTANECVPSELQEGHDCDFSLEGVTQDKEWLSYIPENLKFFKLIGKVKLGSGSCKPECRIRPDCEVNPPQYCFIDGKNYMSNK